MPNRLLHLVPDLRQEGNYIISLGQLCRWLAEQAEAMGVEIYPGSLSHPKAWRQYTK